VFVGSIEYEDDARASEQQDVRKLGLHCLCLGNRCSACVQASEQQAVGALGLSCLGEGIEGNSCPTDIRSERAPLRVLRHADKHKRVEGPHAPQASLGRPASLTAPRTASASQWAPRKANSRPPQQRPETLKCAWATRNPDSRLDR
jgi:hypothetical protein